MDFFAFGPNPKVLITGGMHGDEFETTMLLEEYMFQNKRQLVNVMYIPKMSPSALLTRSRTNERGRDLNRCFVGEGLDIEAQEAIKCVKNLKFDFAIDFHEDPDLVDEFYLYDNDGREERMDVTIISKGLDKLGLKPFFGIDDPNDPLLRTNIEHGYVHVEIEDDGAGFWSHWLIKNNIVPRVWDPEIPGRANMQVKRKLIKEILSWTNLFPTRV